jgi:5-methyltetrahydropteroyltriglutamate--homocysteine methyltransferase
VAKAASVTAGRKKLAALGITLPPIPTAAAGSLPKPADLIELRYRMARGIQVAGELDRKEKLSAELWIRTQERAGLDVLVEGDQARGDMISHFAKKMDGFSPGGLVRVYGNRFYRRPVVSGPVAWKQPIMADTWKVTQRMTRQPVKAILTGPVTLADWSFNEHYPNREALVRDLVVALRKEMSALSDAGAKIVQIDEPALSVRPAEFSLVADAIKELVAGFKFYVILHHAFGNLTPVWKPMQALPVDQFSLEAANSGMAFLSSMKKLGTDKDVAVGVIDAHSRLVETPAILKDRVKIASSAVPAAQLWLTTDSGLRTRTADETISKLKALAQAATRLRTA